MLKFQNYFDFYLFDSDDEATIKSRVLYCATDDAAYMKLTIAKLRGKGFEKMVHVTCLNHALHNLSKKVLASYEKVKELIFAVKNLLIKSPKRCAVFRKSRNKKLPVFPVVSRYGSGLKSVAWYAASDNFDHTIESTKAILTTAKAKHNVAL